MVPLLSLLLLLQGDPAAEAARSWEFPAHHLTVELTEGLTPVGVQTLSDSMTLQRWQAKAGEHDLHFSLVVVPRQEWGLHDAIDVLDNIAFNRRRGEKGAAFRLEDSTAVAGPYGTLPFGATATAAMWDVTERVGTEFFLAGLTEDKGWSLRLRCTPLPDEATKEAIARFLAEGVRYAGPTEDPEWTEEEALARWERDSPPEVRGDMEIFRTAHYIIFTNSSSGKKFAKKMEECYEAIQETYPFEEVEGRKLMPVFLFRTREEYIDYYARIADISRERAANSKGHAWKDYYATYYDSPVDPVHIHEATHQIFKNRLKLGGGGSWFQEGVAEYMSTSRNERKGYARNAARRGGFTPFREFVVIPSLLQSAGKSSAGEDLAGNHYAQAASIIEFLRDSKFGRDGFPRFLREVGSVRRGDLQAIEAAVQRVYEVDLEGLQAEWIEYWD
ncbi:MAG: hypothetical protein ACYTF3_04640 [Planctomycetota bacterium]|jgi:hypothetical protein